MERLIRKRQNFGKVPTFLDVPDLIEIQTRSYDKFLQKDVPFDKREETGLQSAFMSVFPIVDYNETASIEFLGYTVGEPKLSVQDSLQKGLTYAASLKIKVKLNLWEFEQKGEKKLKESREEDVYIGEIQLMTTTGTFII
ncbi:MAG: DNA-directed RNA polymerase subunit beta, partial [Nitrospira sp.]|nr:DNA-directed RNA polymerase subunit beta [Nitrospira sp.]